MSKKKTDRPSGAAEGSNRPAIADSIQYWGDDWMVAQYKSARKMRRHRLARKGVSLEYDAPPMLRRANQVAALVPVVLMIAGLLLVRTGLKNRWLTGGRSGMLNVEVIEGGIGGATATDESALAVDPVATMVPTEEKQGAGLFGRGLTAREKLEAEGPLGIMPTADVEYVPIPSPTPGGMLSFPQQE